MDRDHPIISLETNLASCVNFASAQNDIPVIRRLALLNNGQDVATDLKVSVSATPPVIRTKTWAIDSLVPDESLTLHDLATPLDLGALAGLNETERGTLCFQVLQGSERVVSETHELSLLAKDHWGGLAEMDRLIAAYVSPNDGHIAPLLKEASRLLENAGHSGSLEGYQANDPRRVWMIAGAIWSAITGLGLSYAVPAASFETRGQKIRSPGRIKREGLATCLDTSLLLAAAWEQTGLHPVVLFTEGHAFCGVWLVPKDFGTVTESDVVAVRKAIQAREFVAVETTFLTKRPTIGFDEAADAGRARLHERREHEFVRAVDIARARSARIRPLASHAVGPQKIGDSDDVRPARLPPPLDSGMLPMEEGKPVPDTPRGRIDRWQSKLLDLSLRNRLLNFKLTKQTVPCLVPDVGSLDDVLADGNSFKTYALYEEDPIGERQVGEEERAAILSSAVEDAYERGQVTVPLDKSETDKRLLTLYRRAKSDLAEGGTNTLFLAAGFLRWQREGESRPYRAPLLLIPIKLERRSARSEVRIVHHEDEIRFNATLIEFLKRDFDLPLPGMDDDLPRDESGIDLPLIFQTIRNAVRDVRGLEVVEDLVLSTFSFAKYLMWKDLVDRTEDLCNNRLVAHLVDNPEQTFASCGSGDAVEPKDLDRRMAPCELFTPLPADSSQLAAVVAAMQERDFVLIGPPGTGKSQTIANIISQCLAHGKTVLFVAEKAAALDVVQRRLNTNGLGDAVLELHSSKTDRKRVLSQLGNGWDRAAGQSEQDWLRVNQDIQVTRDQLNAYVEALHCKGTQGFSIFEALGWVADNPKGFQLSFANKDAHDADSFHDLRSLIKDLELTHAATRDTPKMALVMAETSSFAWEEEFLAAAKDLRQSLDLVLAQSLVLADHLGIRADLAFPPARMNTLDTLAKRIETGALDLSGVPDLSKPELLAALDSFKDLMGQVTIAKGELAAFYSEGDILERIPLEALDHDWHAANGAIWPFSVMERRKIKKILQSYAQSGKAVPESDLPALLRLYRDLKTLATDPIVPLAGKNRSISRASTLCEQAVALHEALSGLSEDIQDTVAFETAKTKLVKVPEGALKDALVA
ncbi:MAG: DUF4011 domain-containing protein, partial [Rhodobacteraceae bacterium]|nr:DUF4011 domain-containing protein [Paracoccaceae bacterium]